MKRFIAIGLVVLTFCSVQFGQTGEPEVVLPDAGDEAGREADRDVLLQTLT